MSGLIKVGSQSQAQHLQHLRPNHTPEPSAALLIHPVSCSGSTIPDTNGSSPTRVDKAATATQAALLQLDSLGHECLQRASDNFTTESSLDTQPATGPERAHPGDSTQTQQAPDQTPTAPTQQTPATPSKAARKPATKSSSTACGLKGCRDSKSVLSYLFAKCPYCAGIFCPRHRLPENHKCAEVDACNAEAKALNTETLIKQSLQGF